jgi:hypothetical protein
MVLPIDLNVLPGAYGTGLGLPDLGADDETIGECLGVDQPAVSTLSEIWRQKLAAGSRLGPSDLEWGDFTLTGEIA